MDLSLVIVAIAVVFVAVFLSTKKKKNLVPTEENQPFPEPWRALLLKKVLFYKLLNEADRIVFEKRIQHFTATKNIEGVDTDIDDDIRVLVATSAIIPTFAFPDYNYPNVQSILIYPGSFDYQFQTQKYEGHKEFITGMVGNRFMNGTVILSKPDLIKAYDGLPHKSNVGIHEFVHLLDKEDGEIDGIPEALLQHKYVGPWLHEIKKEMHKIKKGNSDINPYALTNNAEFLAVVSEYFLDHPEKFHKKHPELYKYLCAIFNKQ